MFIIPQIKSLIRNIEARKKFIDLLNYLHIKALKNGEFPNFDDFDSYKKLADELESKICEKLKSDNIFEGLENILKIATIDYSKEETNRELIAKIVKYKDNVRKAILDRNK